jgi:hypothetical protein
MYWPVELTAAAAADVFAAAFAAPTMPDLPGAVLVDGPTASRSTLAQVARQP